MSLPSPLPASRRRRLLAALAVVVAVPMAVLSIDEAVSQPPAKPVQSKKPDANGYIAQFSIEEIMEAMVMPAAQALWDSVAVSVTEKGIAETKPQTGEDWEKLRWQAIALIEATNLLVVPGRRAAHPGATSENPGTELEPAQIQALLDHQRPSFIAHAHVLQTNHPEAYAAADAPAFPDESSTRWVAPYARATLARTAMPRSL